MDRIRVERSGSGWRLVDTKGRLHSARIKDRERCQRQADAMNARLERLGKLAPEEGAGA